MIIPERLKRIATRLVVGISGTTLTSDERRWLQQYQPAGVILFARNVVSGNQLRALCNDIHALLPVGSEIHADHEGGPVSVLSRAIGHPPAPFTLGLVDDLKLTFDVYRNLALRAKACGVDRLLAPCADILSEPLNPVIGSRSFGRDADHTGRHVSAAVKGLKAGGINCCLKHWPGHGHTIMDSHLELEPRPVPDQTSPFLKGLQAGADAVMIGHLPTDVDALPASLDRLVINRLGRLAPTGTLIFSDDLTMGALCPTISRLTGQDYSSGEMLDPGEIDAPWIEAVAVEDMDRLLCRGIPWRALPLSADDLSESSTTAEPADDISMDLEPESWAQARTLIATPCLGPVDAELAWLDCASHHRWPSLDLQGIRTAGWAGTIKLIDQQEGTSSCSNLLLITSHAPLTISWLLSNLGVMPVNGCCLTMGHPSLAQTLASVLPQGWLIHSTYDTDVSDLTPFLTL